MSAFGSGLVRSVLRLMTLDINVYYERHDGYGDIHSGEFITLTSLALFSAFIADTLRQIAMQVAWCFDQVKADSLAVSKTTESFVFALLRI